MEECAIMNQMGYTRQVFLSSFLSLSLLSFFGRGMLPDCQCYSGLGQHQFWVKSECRKSSSRMAINRWVNKFAMTVTMAEQTEHHRTLLVFKRHDCLVAVYEGIINIQFLFQKIWYHFLITFRYDIPFMRVVMARKLTFVIHFCLLYRRIVYRNLGSSGM